MVHLELVAQTLPADAGSAPMLALDTLRPVARTVCVTLGGAKTQENGPAAREK
jgi:hypothetical protein